MIYGEEGAMKGLLSIFGRWDMGYEERTNGPPVLPLEEGEIM